jgi:His/Glu/Gln/Arg/opine family amino acid ABC transporter permease subunit
MTLKFTLFSSIGGLFLGLFLALLKLSRCKSAQAGAVFYTSVFRGTPLLLQLSIIYFGTPGLLDYKISPMVAGVIAFSLNSAAYVSEIIRSGIQAIDRGQFEAAKALGVPSYLMMKDIILPQAVRNTLPSLVNETISLLKETALISTLGEEDIMRRAQLIAAETYTYFGPLMMAAVCYYVLVLILSALAKMLEKKLSHDHR